MLGMGVEEPIVSLLGQMHVDVTAKVRFRPNGECTDWIKIKRCGSSMCIGPGPINFKYKWCVELFC